MKPVRQSLDVLIVDDDSLLLEAVEAMVESLGCRVVTAGDGAAALRIIRERHFDIVITDWQMPILDGIGLVGRLRAEQGDQYLYIMMMTTRAAERSLREALYVEIDSFVFKPIDPTQLELDIASAGRIVDLQRRLARRNRHLTVAMDRARTAYRRIRADLDLAAATQRSLLPAMQTTGALRYSWLFIPSLGVGGDTLNVCQLQDRRRFFFQLDVSGHGIPAALRSFALHQRLSGRPPKDTETMQLMVAALNRDAQDDTEGAYYTLICGLIAADGSQVDYIRAGHPMPVILDAAGTRKLPNGNPPLGLLPALSYDVVNVRLQPGDRLLIHSDGLTDCTDSGGQEFGDTRVANLLAAYRNRPLNEFISGLESDLHRFRGARSFEDDVSVLVFELERTEDKL